MSSNRVQLSRVLKRDDHVCGIHMSGCGRKLPTKKSATRDHIIPESFFSFMPLKARTEFNQDWNIQPMCPKCNNELRVGQVCDWPLFKCKCHYLQISEDGGMYIHERTEREERKHLFLEEAVGDGTKLQLFPSRLPGSGNSIGYSKIEKNRGGHILIPILEQSAPAFNWFELARIGEATGQLLHEGKNGEKCFLYPNGMIVPSSKHQCAQWFPVELGHHNLRYNPFRPGSQESEELLECFRSGSRALG